MAQFYVCIFQIYPGREPDIRMAELILSLEEDRVDGGMEPLVYGADIKGHMGGLDESENKQTPNRNFFFL